MKLFLSSPCPFSSCTHFPSNTFIILPFSLFNDFPHSVLAANAGFCVLARLPPAPHPSQYLTLSASSYLCPETLQFCPIKSEARFSRQSCQLHALTAPYIEIYCQNLYPKRAELIHFMPARVIQRSRTFVSEDLQENIRSCLQW